MALGDPYCSTAELRDYCQIPDNVDDVQLATVAAAISNGIESYCRRQFNDAVTPSARVYVPDSTSHVIVDDFHTVTGLVVKTGDGAAGVFGTTLTDYTLYPLNGVQHGRTGFPWRRIVLPAASFVTSTAGRGTVQVTARWGWAAVPADVKVAALIQGARVFGRRNSPHGLISVGSGDYPFRVSRIDDPDVVRLLADFRLPCFGVA